MHERIIEAKAEKRTFAPCRAKPQVIIGADETTDANVLAASARLYDRYALRRVYYSAFSPIPEPSVALPIKPPPLQRENRLYQADWLLRFYGFSVEEIAAEGEHGMLDLDADPKLAWALKHRDQFPVDVNRAPRELLLRVPGLGTRPSAASSRPGVTPASASMTSRAPDREPPPRRPLHRHRRPPGDRPRSARPAQPARPASRAAKPLRMTQIALAAGADLAGFRQAVRELAAAGFRPEEVSWTTGVMPTLSPRSAATMPRRSPCPAPPTT